MRLDLRLIAGRLGVFLGLRLAKTIVSLTARAALSAYELLCVSTLMQVGLALPMAYYSHRATVLGIPANALAVPLTGILMPAAVLAVALSYVWMPLAKAPAILTAWSLHGITGAVRGLGGLRIADHRVAMPEATTVILAAGALALAIALAWRPRVLLLGGLAVLTSAGLWVSAGVPDAHVRREVIELTAIDVVAITHGHSDHIGGLHAVLNNFRPQELWIGALPETPTVTALLAYAWYGTRTTNPSNLAGCK